MSVIFKEKKFDRLLILFNNLLIIFLAALILLTGFNFINSSKAEKLDKRLEQLQEEELKYIKLLKAAARDEKSEKIESNKYRLLISLAAYADNIIYNSLSFKNNMLNLKAAAVKQDRIFELIDQLEADPKISEVDLVNINQEELYYFELNMLTGQ
jgi:hypothetical protein